MRKFTATSILSTALLVLFSVAGVATASDEKFYPGMTCQGNDLGYNSDGAILNLDATYDHWAYCPIVRDNLHFEQISSARVYVYDAHTSDTLYCYLYARDYDGDLIEWKYDTTADLDDENFGDYHGTAQLSFNDVGYDTTNYYYHHYYIRCNIPDVYGVNESFIGSYRATEDNP